MSAPPSSSPSVTVRTPAKINLYLGVGPRRPDGFHPLATVYQAVGLYDDLRARAAAAGTFSIRVHGDEAGLVPQGEDNLAVRAARLLAEEYGVDAGAALHLRKAIPVEAGLAGGSSDAAAALVACAQLWGLEISREELSAFASRLGSDVPFCLVGGTAIGSGRGEQVSPVLSRGAYTWVLAAADGGLSTPAVYAEFDRLAGRNHTVPADPVVPDDVMAALRSGSPHLLAEALANDLQPAALLLRPELVTALEVGDAAGALGSLVSGSGPTTFFLAADEQQADQIAAQLLTSGTCRTAMTVPGPVTGAKLQ